MLNLKQRLKDVGMCAIGILAMAVLLLVVLLLLHGMVWVSDKVLPWLAYASVIVLVLYILVFLPLSLFRKTRGFSILCYYFASYGFGVTLWAYSCLIAFALWGYVGLILGLVLLGVGVVPIACLASIFHSAWGTLEILAAGIILTFGTRGFALYLTSKAEGRQ
jgi:hypothetical protein